MIVPPRTRTSRPRLRSGEPGWRAVVLGAGAFLILVAACFYVLALAGR